MKFVPLKNFKEASILISNDDGINSPALKLLENEISKLCPNITVVAPLGERSGSSHAITAELTALEDYDSWMHLPRRIEKYDDNHYAIDGTPADCVNIGINMICAERRPDLVVTGINMGRNLAEDITYSGTVGAAIEGVINGIFSVAFSQQMEGKEPDWEIAKKYCPLLLQKIAAESFDINTLVNINFPNIPLADLKGIHVGRHGERRFPDKSLLNYEIVDDYQLIENKYISITPLKIDFTDYHAIEKLKKIFKTS